MTRRRSPSTDKNSQAAALLALAAAQKPPPTPCLDDEQLALLLDGRAGNKRETLLAHLAHCPDCYQRWSLAGSGRPRRFFSWGTMRPLSLVLAAAACVALYIQVVKLGESPIAPVPMSRPTPSVEKAEQSAEVPVPQVKEPAAPQAVPTSPPARVAKDKEDAAPVALPPIKGKAATSAVVEPAPGPTGKSAVPRQKYAIEKDKKEAELPAPRQAAKSAAPSSVVPAPSPVATGEGRVVFQEASPQESQVAAPALADQAIAPPPASRKATVPAKDAPAEWRRELATACRQGLIDASVWRELAERGRRLQAQGTDREKAALAALLALLQGMDGPETVAPACRSILDELAKNGADK